MSWDPFGLFGDLNHMIITRNDTAEPRDSNFLNSGIRPDSWVGWSHVQNYEQPLLSHSWKDRLTWNGPDSLGSTDFPPAYQHSQTAGMCSLPAAEPLHLSMYWKALMTPFSPRLYTHFAFMTGLGKRDCVATVALKRDSCGSAMTHVSICRIWQHLLILLRPPSSRCSCCSPTAVPRKAEINPGGTEKMTWGQSPACSGKSTIFSEGT